MRLILALAQCAFSGIELLVFAIKIHQAAVPRPLTHPKPLAFDAEQAAAAATAATLRPP